MSQFYFDIRDQRRWLGRRSWRDRWPGFEGDIRLRQGPRDQLRLARSSRASFTEGLEHRKHDDPVFKLPRRKARARQSLELGSMLLQIAEGLLLRTERGRKPAHLSTCAGSEKERDRSVVRLESRAFPCLVESEGIPVFGGL